MEEKVLLTKEFELFGRDFINAGKASTNIKSILKELGVDQEVVRRVAISTYEAEMNVVLYADRGILKFQFLDGGIRIIIKDEGPGIEDIDKAMEEGYSTATDEIREMGFGAGMGLPNIKKNTNDFRITSEVGKGTRLEFFISSN